MLRSHAASSTLRALPSARRAFATFDSSIVFPHQPESPSVVTESIPGPKSQEQSNVINSFQDNRTHIVVADYAKSR
ncbi:hypothetical protein JCM10212_001283, partial [Sporobolomyces blumeae]